MFSSKNNGRRDVLDTDVQSRLLYIDSVVSMIYSFTMLGQEIVTNRIQHIDRKLAELKAL